MGDTVFAKSPASDDFWKTALHVKRRFGGLEIGVVNTGEVNNLEYKVEAAAGPKDTLEVPDWTEVAIVATAALVTPDMFDMLDLPEASCVHRMYRVVVRSEVLLAPAPYVIWAEDEKL